jgi:hypothetical protein
LLAAEIDGGADQVRASVGIANELMRPPAREEQERRLAQVDVLASGLDDLEQAAFEEVQLAARALYALAKLAGKERLGAWRDMGEQGGESVHFLIPFSDPFSNPCGTIGNIPGTNIH